MKLLPALLSSIIIVLLTDFVGVFIIKVSSNLLFDEVVTFKEVLTDPMVYLSLIIASILMIPFCTWGFMNEEE
ncbi:hypothetical protein MKY30_16190 [Oceanobacillus sp. FSL W8-0428]|uniref:hypothetical protein n=1 Tax=Oceanobacillus sp. FSL W8-0428 TaxID=2921715 RepID=UPI0030FB23DB